MIFHENRLPADDSHEISCHIRNFRKSGKNLNCRLLQNIDGALRVNFIQPISSLKYKLACAYSVDLNQYVRYANSLILSILPEGTLDPWLSIARLLKTLIRLPGWAGRSEYSI